MDSTSNSPLDVVLLVGGLGTRLRSVLGDSTPKALALIKGRPFLWYLLHHIAAQGFDQVTLATAHLSDSFKEDLQSYVPEGMTIQFSFEASPRGTGGAIVQAYGVVQSSPFIAMNGDVFVKVPLQQMVEEHQRTGAKATLAIVEVDNVARFGTVRADDDHQIEAFLEKTGIESPGWISAGVYVLSAEALSEIMEMEVSSIERDVFPKLVGNGLYAFPVISPFIDIGLPETLEAAGKFFEECGYA